MKKTAAIGIAFAAMLLSSAAAPAADYDVLIKGGTVYGFTAGPEGMVFLTIRGGDSVTNFKN